jgi:NAD(P)H-dependent flavin oxidoreductase YrpB (nitropropane dioxygenase family)
MSLKGTAAKMLLAALVFFLSGIFEFTKAQDVLVLKSGKEMKVIITEEISDVIKYREYADASGPLYSIDKTKVESVKYDKKLRNAKEDKAAKNVETETSVEPQNTGALTVKKRYILQDGRVMSTRQVKNLMEDNPKALELYTSGKKMTTSSNSCAYGIIAICAVANIATNKMEDDRKMKVLGTALAISGGLVITGIVLASKGKKKIRQSVDIYNTDISKPVSYDYELNLKISGQGVGVALRF